MFAPRSGRSNLSIKLRRSTLDRLLEGKFMNRKMIIAALASMVALTTPFAVSAKTVTTKVTHHEVKKAKTSTGAPATVATTTQKSVTTK